MKKYLRYLGPVLVTAIFLLAVYLLYHKLKSYSMAEIRASIDQISAARMGASLLLMAVNYMILVGYDWLALKAIHKTLPLPRVALVSFVGQAVSYNFGALLGGTSVRFRFYSAWGFSLAEIVRLVLMLAVTFWVGVLGLCGVIFMVAPPVIPGELLAKMPLQDIRILGVGLTLIACSYLALCCVVRKPVHIFGKEFVFPAPRIAFAQALVAWVDIIAAAGCMYVLLPGHMNISFLDFLPSYLLAQVAVVLTHIPGGVGVFELVILHLTHTAHEQTVFAAVLLFRLIYFILPLLAAALLLAVYEVRQRRNMLREAGRWLSVLSHSISAYMVFTAGAILLASALLAAGAAHPAYGAGAHPLPGGGCGAFCHRCERRGAAVHFLRAGTAAGQGFSTGGALSGVGACGVAAQRFFLDHGADGVPGVLHGLPGAAAVLPVVVFWEEPIPAFWLAGALGVLGLAAAVAWALYHPSLNKAAQWGFDRPHMAAQTLYAFGGVAVGLVASWLWRAALRQRKRRRERRR